jgi:SET domain-containing protein
LSNPGENPAFERVGILPYFAIIKQENMGMPFLYIGPTESRGRGVYTSEDIEEGVLVEVSPVIVMSQAERLLLDQTLLHDYIFEWGDQKDQCCMAMGYVPVYNHSYQSNCEYGMDYEQQLISVTTVRPIKAGEELLVNYNGDWNDATPLWFEVK